MLTVCGTQPYTRSHSQRANFCRMLNGVPCAPTSHNYHILYAQVHRNNATITTAKKKQTNHNIFIMIRFSRFLFSLSLSPNFLGNFSSFPFHPGITNAAIFALNVSSQSNWILSITDCMRANVLMCVILCELWLEYNFICVLFRLFLLSLL